MIIKLMSDGRGLGERRVISVDPKKGIGAAVGLMLRKLGMDSMEGYGLWLCEGENPPLPVVALERRDVPLKLGMRQGDVVYIKKETVRERRIAIKEVEELLRVKTEDPAAYRNFLKIAKTIEAARQLAAKRIHAMRLLGTEWHMIDPAKTAPDASCAICLHPLSSSSDPVQLAECLHQYHESCILAWLGKGTGLASAKCPVCRRQINSTDPYSDDSDDDDYSPPVIRRWN